MYKQSPSRNHRSKGIKVKHILQICVLLALCFWLIYQVKHSHERRKNLGANDDQLIEKIQIDDEIQRLGRKILPEVLTMPATKVETHIEDEEEREAAEENKHDEDEQDGEDGIRVTEEDADRGGGDDEVDENEDEKIEVDHEEEEEEEEQADEENEREREKEEDDSSSEVHIGQRIMPESMNMTTRKPNGIRTSKKRDGLRTVGGSFQNSTLPTLTDDEQEKSMNLTSDVGAQYSAQMVFKSYSSQNGIDSNLHINMSELVMDDKKQVGSDKTETVNTKSDESSDYEASDTSTNEVQHDPIDESDTVLTQEEKESETDLNTISEIRTEAQDTDSSMVE